AALEPTQAVTPQPYAIERKSALAILGWVVLVVTLVGAGGAIAYFTVLGLRNADKPKDVGTEVAPPPPRPNPAAVAIAPVTDAARVPPDAAPVPEPVPEPVVEPNPTAPEDEPKQPSPSRSVRPHPSPKTAAIVKELTAQAQKLERAGKWNDARWSWEKLGK